MSRVLLIDGDVLVYESSFGAQRNRYIVTLTASGEVRPFNNAKDRDSFLKEKGIKDNPEAYSVEKVLDVLEEPAALAICKNKLTALTEKLSADRIHIYLTGKGNFREEVATLSPYKGQRKEVEKPVHFAACRSWFENHAQSSVVNGQEADDAIGIAAMAHHRAGTSDTIIVCSIDKDLRQIPGAHYEWHNDLKYKVSFDAADRWFWMQMVMGDSADNIPGIKGIGEARAKTGLGELSTREARAAWVQQCYEKQYGKDWRPWADEVGALLWIRRMPGQIWSWTKYMAGALEGA